MSIDPKTVEIGVEVAVGLFEWAMRVGPGLVKAIESHGSYTAEQKADLIARVKAAGNYMARDLDAVPAPAPTRPD